MSTSTGYVGSTNRYDTYRNRDGNGSIRYPSPFFDIGHTYLPTSVKQMFRWCRYYFMTNPIINAVTYKMSEYPITPIIVEESDADLREKWEDVIENKLRLRSFQIEAGLDYHCYGNAFITIHFPFDKYLICNNCGHRELARNSVYKFRNLKYHLVCKKCEVTTEAKVHDHNVKNLKGIRLIRWNPEHITVEHNEITGESTFFFDIPVSVRNDIMMGKRHIVETIPNEFISAIRDSKSLRFNEGEMFHLKRPTIGQKDQGWGMPLILPVLKDTYYLQILRKAQESIAQQYIVPLRILFPQAAGATSDPYSTTDLGQWKKRIESEIEKWKLDQNYIPILPLPVGNMSIGGEGKALMLHQEMRAWSEQIVAGMQVPIEFVFGGLQYSGSNVSMRMLENQFLGYRNMLSLMCNDFILARVARYMGWPAPRTKLRRFRMADDLQRSALMFQLNQAQKISDTSLLDEVDHDIVVEEKHKRAELDKQLENQRRQQLASAAIQGDLQIINARYQAHAMRIMATSGGVPAMPPSPQGMGSGAGGATTDSQPQPPPPPAVMPAGGPPVGMEDQQPDMGAQAAPGMPSGATAYPENGNTPPEQGTPTEVESPLNMQQQGGGYNILYLARRAATALSKLPEAQKHAELMHMRATNQQLYQIVLSMLVSEQGSQADNADPGQSPLPEVKPPRRQVPIV